MVTTRLINISYKPPSIASSDQVHAILHVLKQLCHHVQRNQRQHDDVHGEVDQSIKDVSKVHLQQMRGSGRVFIKGGAESHAVNERVQDRWQRDGMGER